MAPRPDPAGARTRQAARLLAAVCVVLVAAHAVVIAHRRASQGGDFDISREFGRRFLAGESLYAGGLHYPYPPTAAMFFAPLALAPPTVAFAARYAAALLALWLTLAMLHRMLVERFPGLSSQKLAIGSLAVLLASHYVIRDLDDGGPHLILLALLAAAIRLAAARRDLPAAACLGLLAALKPNLGLFLPFLVLKRRWRLAALSAVAVLFWTLVPIARMGAASWAGHEIRWARVAFASALGRPIPEAEESERRVQNQSLRQVAQRWAGATPESPVPPAAAVFANLTCGALLVAFAFWARRPVDDRDPRFLLEASGVAILAVLSSPVTWVQHLVFATPALYLIAAEDRGIRPLGAGARAAVAVYAILALLLNRAVLGRTAYLTLLQMGLHAVAMLILLAILVLRRPAAAAGRA